MDNVINIANYIIKRYKEISKSTLDELKLHKLLYFVQRETFAILGKPAFEEDLEGWKFGPVSKEVRQVYLHNEIIVETEEISPEMQYIVNNVIEEYGALESWKLVEISHGEISWINSRKGFAPNENGNVPLKLSDIEEDAKKVRPYDYVWDMYYDEFDNAEVQ